MHLCVYLIGLFTKCCTDSYLPAYTKRSFNLTLQLTGYTANTKLRFNALLMQAHPLQRWLNIKTTLSER